MSLTFWYLCRFPYFEPTPASDEPLIDLCPGKNGIYSQQEELVEVLRGKLRAPQAYAVSESGQFIAVAYPVDGCCCCGCWCFASGADKVIAHPGYSLAKLPSPRHEKRISKRRKVVTQKAPAHFDIPLGEAIRDPSRKPNLTEDFRASHLPFTHPHVTEGEPCSIREAVKGTDSSTHSGVFESKGSKQGFATPCRYLCIFLIDALTRSVVDAWSLRGHPYCGKRVMCNNCKSLHERDIGSYDANGADETIQGMHFACNDGFLCLTDRATHRIWLIDLQKHQCKRAWEQKNGRICIGTPMVPTVAAVFSLYQTDACSFDQIPTIDACDPGQKIVPSFREIKLAQIYDSKSEQQIPGCTLITNPKVWVLDVERLSGERTLSLDGNTLPNECANKELSCKGHSLTEGFVSRGRGDLLVKFHSPDWHSGAANGATEPNCPCQQLIPPEIRNIGENYVFHIVAQHSQGPPLLLEVTNERPTRHVLNIAPRKAHQLSKLSNASVSCANIQTLLSSAVVQRNRHLWGCGLRFLAWPQLPGVPAACAEAAAALDVFADPSKVLVKRCLAVNTGVTAAAEKLAEACCNAVPLCYNTLSTGSSVETTKLSDENISGVTRPAAGDSNLQYTCEQIERVLHRAAIPLSRPSTVSLDHLLGRQLSRQQLHNFYRKLRNRHPQLEMSLQLPCEFMLNHGAQRVSEAAATSPHSRDLKLPTSVAVIHTSDDNLALEYLGSRTHLCSVDLKGVTDAGSVGRTAEFLSGSRRRCRCVNGRNGYGVVRTVDKRSVLAVQADAHGLHVLTQLHTGGIGVLRFVGRIIQRHEEQSSVAMESTKVAAPLSYGGYDIVLSVQGALRYSEASRICLATFGRESCGTKPVAVVFKGDSRVFVFDWFKLLPLTLPRHCNTVLQESDKDAGYASASNSVKISPKRNPIGDPLLSVVCIPSQLDIKEISFWPQYDALIVQLAQLECCSSKETSRARQKDGILVDSLNELRVVLQSWGRCSDKAATWEFDLGDRILDVQLPRHITARDLEGCSTYFLRKLHKHAWRESWLRAADCLVRSRAHFAVRLDVTKTGRFIDEAFGGLEGKRLLSALALLPVCSPVSLAPHVYSADRLANAVPSRWEEIQWDKLWKSKRSDLSASVSLGDTLARVKPPVMSCNHNDVRTSSVQRHISRRMQATPGFQAYVQCWGNLCISEHAEALPALALRDEIFGTPDSEMWIPVLNRKQQQNSCVPSCKHTLVWEGHGFIGTRFGPCSLDRWIGAVLGEHSS